MLRTAIAIFVLVLSACGSTPSVTENQCRAGDWQTIGYRDGAAGMSSTRLLAHQEACGVIHIVPNRSGYLAGWNNGLVEYCTAESGFHLGQRGGNFNTICNSLYPEPFSSAYKDGRTLYVARAEVNRLLRLINNHEGRLEHIKQEIVAIAAAQLQPGLSPEARINMLARVESLAEERGTIQAELPQLESALIIAELDLDQLRQSLASAGY